MAAARRTALCRTAGMLQKARTEVTAKVTEIKANLEKLKLGKEKFLMEQGLQSNNFDSFFAGSKWANLRANASVGTEALELMEKLTKLERSVAAVEQVQGSATSTEHDPELDEDMHENDEIDDVLSTDVAEAYEEARKAGKELTADELKDVQKKEGVSQSTG